MHARCSLHATSVHEAEPAVLQGIMVDIISAVAELHEHGIVHGRLDGQSVVLTENTVVRGCLGEARRRRVFVSGAKWFQKPSSLPQVIQDDGKRPFVPVICGLTFGASSSDADSDSDDEERGVDAEGYFKEYAAPEVLDGGAATAASDIWSIGAIMTEAYRFV